tara:strand:+ start:729 stop:1451 length:723 start_codon:yes stop_codon:yes gene_type:complete
MSASLQNELIADLYTSLLHLSGGDLNKLPAKRDVYDGIGNVTGLALSGTKVISNNVELPEQHVGSAEATEDKVTSLVDMFFPVGSIQMTIDNINPGTRIPGTVWEIASEGRFVVGVGGRNPSNGYAGYTPENNIGGSDGQDSHVSLSEDQIPAHTHVPNSFNGQFGNVLSWTSSVDVPGGGDGGAINKQIPVGQTSQFIEPIYGFPDIQPIAQKLSIVGKNQAFSTSPMSYGAYIWKRTQ